MPKTMRTGRPGSVGRFNYPGSIGNARKIGRSLQHRRELRQLYRAGHLCDDVRVVHLFLRIGFRVRLDRLPLCFLCFGVDDGSVRGGGVANTHPRELNEVVRGVGWCWYGRCWP